MRRNAGRFQTHEHHRREEGGAYRVIYTAKIADAVYVLHAFQKKSQKTAPADLELAKKRYNKLIQEKK